MAVVVPGDYIALIINTITACYKIVLSNLSLGWHFWAGIRDFKFRNTSFGSLDEVQDAHVDSFQYLDNNKDMVSK